MSGKKRYKVDQIIEAIQQGQTPQGAAKVLGCHPDTIRNYARSNNRIMSELQSQRKDMIDIAERGLRRHLERGEAWAISFTLKTIGKDHGYTERSEITGKDSEALQIVVTYKDKE